MDDLLKDYESWLHKRAYQLNSVSERHEDVVQEGRIAMWQAYKKYKPGKGALPSWLTQHATWHMKEVISRGGTWTGKPKKETTSRVPVRVTDVHSVDFTEAREGLSGSVSDHSGESGMAYHRGEVREALDGLTEAQRLYVKRRFGAEMRDKELKGEFGYDPSALWNSKKNGAKYKLREKLAHLKGIYT